MPTGPRLLAIEDRLAADPTGQERDRLHHRLQQLRANARRELDRGQPPAEARRWLSLIAAVDAADIVLARLWTHLNRASS